MFKSFKIFGWASGWATAHPCSPVVTPLIAVFHRLKKWWFERKINPLKNNIDPIDIDFIKYLNFIDVFRSITGIDKKSIPQMFIHFSYVFESIFLGVNSRAVISSFLSELFGVKLPFLRQFKDNHVRIMNETSSSLMNLRVLLQLVHILHQSFLRITS